MIIIIIQEVVLAPLTHSLAAHLLTVFVPLPHISHSSSTILLSRCGVGKGLPSRLLLFIAFGMYSKCNYMYSVV